MGLSVRAPAAAPTTALTALTALTAPVTALTDLKEALSLEERFVVCAGSASLTPWVLLPSPRPRAPGPAAAAEPPAPPLLSFPTLPSLRFLPLGRTWTWRWVVRLRLWGRQEE